VSLVLAGQEADHQLILANSHPVKDERLVRLTWPTVDEMRAGRTMLEEVFDVDVWRRTGNSLDVRLRPSDDDDYIAQLARATSVETILPSLPTLHHDQASSNTIHSQAAVLNFTTSSSTGRLDDPIHDSYHPYDHIVEILRTFEASYPGFANMQSFGLSSEGREIWGIKISNFSRVYDPLISGKGKKKGKGYKHKVGVVLAGTQHAREWIASSSALFFAHKLLVATLPSDGPASDPDTDSILNLLNILELTIVPVVNVDGYVYTWEEDRLWRKNRQPVGKDCFGVDLNRNWGFKWSGGTRPNPCSDSYPGSEAFQVRSGFISAVERR
jgi:extracellular matrix protein 14